MRYEWQQKASVYEDLLFWILHMTKQDVKDICDHPKAMIYRMAQIICSDWNILVRYIMARLGQIEWELERPDFRPDSNSVDASLAKLHTWRRRLPLYKTMVRDTEEKLFGSLISTPSSSTSEDCLTRMKKDFGIVASGLVELYERTERIATVATAVTAIEESRRGMDQNRALGRLTYLAVIFAPLSFFSSFFSMSSEVSQLTTTIWIFVAVAFPVSFLAFLLVEPSLFKWVKSFIPNPWGKKKKK
jgi:Mg2+ and Co2+ transporter CorA